MKQKNIFFIIFLIVGATIQAMEESDSGSDSGSGSELVQITYAQKQRAQGERLLEQLNDKLAQTENDDEIALLEGIKKLINRGLQTLDRSV